MSSSANLPSHRASWRDIAFKRPIFHTEHPDQASEAAPVTALGIPLAGLDTTVTSSPGRIDAIEQELFGDKLVLTFERHLSEEELSTWFTSFNATNTDFILQLEEQLINSLFVTKVVSLTPDFHLNHLLASSPLEAEDTFASTNRSWPPRTNPRTSSQAQPVVDPASAPPTASTPHRAQILKHEHRSPPKALDPGLTSHQQLHYHSNHLNKLPEIPVHPFLTPTQEMSVAPTLKTWAPTLHL
ncbi:unnamed protein product [Calypogeia fissa]